MEGVALRSTRRGVRRNSLRGVSWAVAFKRRSACEGARSTRILKTTQSSLSGRLVLNLEVARVATKVCVGATLRVEHCAIAPPFEVAVYISENGAIFCQAMRERYKLSRERISPHGDSSRYSRLTNGSSERGSQRLRWAKERVDDWD